MEPSGGVAAPVGSVVVACCRAVVVPVPPLIARATLPAPTSTASAATPAMTSGTLRSRLPGPGVAGACGGAVTSGGGGRNGCGPAGGLTRERSGSTVHTSSRGPDRS